MNPFRKDCPADADAIEAHAAAWLIEMESGVSEEQAAAFAAWCRADPRREAVVAQMRRDWSRLETLRDYRPGARAHPDPDLLTPRPRLRRSAPAWAAGLAAAAVLIATFAMRDAPGFPALPWEDTAHYLTDRGGYNRTTLPDGSVLELNADTEVRLKFTRRQRYVKLLRGEAHFVVAPEAGRPFVVEAQGLHVRAVGTEFNVRADGGTLEVLVTHGRVKVGPPALVRELSPAVPTVSAGQRAVVTELNAPEASATAVEAVSAEDVREALAWQSPPLRFVDAPLSEVVRQFNQRNRVQIALGDAELADVSVGGSFRPENAEAFVRLMASANKVSVERPASNRIVLRRPAAP